MHSGLLRISCKMDRSIAVVGSGITGLSAAWLLHRWGGLPSSTDCGLHELPVPMLACIYNRVR